ncbi:hypothetical protein EE612_045411, partial [Oryza sativa]
KEDIFPPCCITVILNIGHVLALRRLSRMWRTMAERHKAQKRTIDDAKLLFLQRHPTAAAATATAIALSAPDAATPPPAAVALECEIRAWRGALETWLSAQRAARPRRVGAPLPRHRRRRRRRHRRRRAAAGVRGVHGVGARGRRGVGGAGDGRAGLLRRRRRVGVLGRGHWHGGHGRARALRRHGRGDRRHGRVRRRVGGRLRRAGVGGGRRRAGTPERGTDMWAPGVI